MREKKLMISKNYSITFNVKSAKIKD